MNTIRDRCSFLAASIGESRSTIDTSLARDSRPLLIVVAAPGRVPVVSGVRVVAVTSLQDCLVGLAGVPETTPWAEWDAPPRGASILRRQLKARRGRRVGLASDGGVIAIRVGRHQEPRSAVRDREGSDPARRPDRTAGSKKQEVRP
ncbi:hypothetical protein [Amorphus orientalis]|uniref:Uncharacterized protein n=1 Tax=Amorphus orientalis TaxID=649198 RepID=A0AAE3VMR7_9HYPH|nr:hypothetical protein [Amorphus orientalis]MDQ0314825.1 hypothetical protein [Amorphus orientalis]